MDADADLWYVGGGVNVMVIHSEGFHSCLRIILLLNQKCQSQSW